jgi:hypothetical protein
MLARGRAALLLVLVGSPWAVLACTGGGGSDGNADAALPPDGGSADGAPPSDGGTAADVVLSVDGGAPACVDDAAAVRSPATPVYGAFSGAGLAGDICLGGASARLQHTLGSFASPSQIILTIDGECADTRAASIREPANATGACLTLLVGTPSAAPGVYSSAGACGGVVLCLYLPVPPSVDCGDAATPTRCPPGCSLVGPVSAPICQPITPEDCYEAKGASDCVSAAQTPSGSWTLTLTSVTPYGIADGGPGTDFIAHGSLTTALGGDAGPATMSLYF